MDIRKIEDSISKNKNINKIIYFDEINSTQKYVKENSKNLDNGTVVIANNQTNGIGTKNRIWYSEKDTNLTFTVFLKPNETIKKYENLTTSLAKIIVEVIKELYGIDAKIKEPNDVLINNKKVCRNINRN